MKKWSTVVLCTILFSGLVTRAILPVSAQEDIQIDDMQEEDLEQQVTESEPQEDESEQHITESESPAAETESQDDTELIPEAGEQTDAGEQPEESGQEVSPDQTEPSESQENSEQAMGTPSHATPDGSGPEAGNSGAPSQEIPVLEENENNPEVTEAMQAIYSSLDDRIDYIADLLGMSEDYTLIEEDDNLCEALAIYAMRHEQTENFPYEVQITGTDDLAELQSIFWSLNTVNGAKTDVNAEIRVVQYSGAEVYGFSDSKRDMLRSLNSETNKEKVNALLQY